MAKVSLRSYNRDIEAMIDRGQLDEAIAHCQHILKTFPKHLETYRLLGKAYLEYKRYDDAVDIFSRVLAAEPNDFVANVGMSIIRDEQNKLDDAIWHMERAFETQSANPAIQSELQRLYGRRDGIQPPRIRMTRGALAHMYVRGELYPQAISEIKSVLKEDQGRSDMSALLARAYFKSGHKNEAVDAANSVLRRYPYCLDANRVMVEILGADRPENAQAYRQRVVELDPYASQVTSSIFQSSEVGDNAIVIEHLDWSGQPVGMRSDWSAAKALPPETGYGRGAQQPSQSPQAQPDWLKMGLADATPAPQASTPPPPKPTVVPPAPTPSSPLDIPSSNQPASTVPTEEENIPDFLRAAGWGKSTGAFDESKSAFVEEPASSASTGEPIEQGNLPDWVKAMMPSDAAQPAQQPAQSAEPAAEEELPDWIKNIGTGALSSSALKSTDNQPDWLQPSEETTSAQPESGGQPDWMQGFDQPEPAQSPSADASMDWLKGISEPPGTDSQPDWMKGPDKAESAPVAASDDTMDWLNNLGAPASSDETTAQQPVADEQPDWMKGFDQPESAPASAAEDSMDWLKDLGTPAISEPMARAPVADEQPDWMKGFDQPESAPESASDDSMDWLKDLGTPAAPEPAAQASATDDQPDWLDQPANETEKPAEESVSGNAYDFLNEVTEQPEASSAQVTPQAGAGNTGTSQQEIDDSLAWLENLAAKQGATEGLLTKPEERKEEPEWVRRIKAGQQKPVEEQSIQPSVEEPLAQPVTQEPAVQPAAQAKDLGTSQQEIDDSLAWLENLAAKQGATEGLLTKPEERKEEPEWVRRIKAGQQKPVQEQPIQPPVEEPPAQPVAQELPAQPAAKVEDLGTSQQEIDDSLAWLENLAAKQGATEGLLTKPEERKEEPDWVKRIKAGQQKPEQEQPAQPPVEELPVPPPTQESPAPPAAKEEDLGKSQQEIDDSLAWLENLAAKQGATEGLLTQPEERKEEPDWVKQARSVPQEPEQEQFVQPVEEPPAEPEPAAQEPVSSADDTTAWLRSLEQEEMVAEPESASDDTAMWFKNLDEPVEQAPASVQGEVDDDLPAWLKGLKEEETPPERIAGKDETAMWLKGLDKPEPIMPAPPVESREDVPEWLQGLEEEEQAVIAESVVSEGEAGGEFDWLNEIEEESVTASASESTDENLPAWLKGVDQESHAVSTAIPDDLPAWMRDETGEVLAEPTKIEPTRASDWRPSEEKQAEPPAPQPVVQETPKPQPEVESVVTPPPVEVVEEEPKPAPVKKAAPKPAEPKPEPYKESVMVRGTGMPAMPVDSMLGSARNELSRSNIPGALEAYEKLIKKGRFLDEVIFDLREALYRYPVEVSIWQALGDAYMRANRLQDALDAYTKAEELLR